MELLQITEISRFLLFFFCQIFSLLGMVSARKTWFCGFRISLPTVKRATFERPPVLEQMKLKRFFGSKTRSKLKRRSKSQRIF